MLGLAWPWLLALSPLPLLVMLLPPAEAPREPGLRLPFFDAARRWGDAGAGRRPRARVLVAALAWLALVVAACRPQWIAEPEGMAITGRDLMLAVDVSGSMQIRDLVESATGGSRLYVVKELAGEFIRRRTGDRLGLILFGSRAYLQVPLTFDRETVHELLGEAAIGVAGASTAIGDAIGLAVKRLRRQSRGSRVLLLLTDGANTAGEVAPQDAAWLAARHGVRIHVIGVGADQVLVRERRGVRRANPSSDLDEALLRRIADGTGGRYFRARSAEDLSTIYALIDRIEPAIQGTEPLRPRHEVYHWPLSLALALWAWPWLWRRIPGVRRTHAHGVSASG